MPTIESPRAAANPSRAPSTAASDRDATASSPIDFSLFYFASDEGGVASRERYRLILESARYADEHSFAAVWTPERHFHAFGGLSPNPVVTAAALAVTTSRLQLRSGSVVLPLHHPIRVAEEWALVDNLSDGRVGLGVASGWFPDDFVLAPDRYERRSELLWENLDTLRRLWRGETLTLRNGRGDSVPVRTIPRPVQEELPVWITAAGNPETFRQAGAIGANVLTHLLGQSVEDVEKKIALYREAWETAGHPGRGKVSLMLHTFVGSCDENVRETVREPMKRYLGSSVQLVQRYVDSLPIFKNLAGTSAKELSDDDLNAVLEYSFERYYRTSSLLGTARTCSKTVRRMHAIGVDDIACLVDFGLPTDTVLESLGHLDELRELMTESESSEELGAPAIEVQSPSVETDAQTVTESETEIMRRIAEIWSTNLEIETVPLDENFFDLGGHSLLAVRVLTAIENEFDRKLSITDLFRFPTVRTLARYLDGGSGSSTAGESRAEARRQASGRRRRRNRNGR